MNKMSNENSYSAQEESLYKSLFYYLLICLFGLIAGLAISQTLGECLSTYMISFKVTSSSSTLFAHVYSVAFVIISLVFLAKTIASPKTIMLATLPWLIYFPVLLFDLNIFSIIIFIVLSGISVFRLALVLPYPSFAAKLLTAISTRKWLLLTGIITAVFTGIGIYMSHVAYRVQFLCFGDWGIFTEVAANTLNGDFLRTNWHGGINFFSHHYMPGFFLIFTPLIWLFNSPYTTIVFGAFTLWGSAILLYWFARTKQISPTYAFCLAFAYLLYPSLSNLNISIFYGFHVIYFFIPVFIIFYVFYEREKFLIAFLIFLYSLTIRETVGTFWVGWGIIQFLSGKKRDGLLYAFIGAVFFILYVKLLIPACGTGNYIYFQERYAHLGSGILEIMVSPILRPAAFWGSLFTIKNLAVTLLLLTPTFIVAFNRPLLLLCSAPQLMFVFIQNNQEIINLCLQYQSETIAMINITGVIGMATLLKNEKHTYWARILSIGLARKETLSKNNIACAMVIGLLTTSVLANYFYSLSYYGCYSFKPIANMPDCTQVVIEMKKIVPPTVEIAASTRVGANFMIRNQVYPLSFDKEYRIYDLNDSLDGSAQFHNAMLNNKDYGLIWFKLYKGHQFFIFKKGAIAKYPKPVYSISQKEWEVAGQPIEIPTCNEDFSVKMRVEKNDKNQTVLICVFKIIRKINYECEINVRASFNDKNFYWLIPFGYGYYPATKAEPGEAFKLVLPLPSDWDGLSSAGIKIKEKR